MPNTIAENLTRLQTARTNIATAITGKGGTVASGAGFEDFSTAIGTIPSGGGSQDLIDLIERDITSISIPSGITKIGDAAFSQCKALTSVTMPNTVTEIGASAFSTCTSLAQVNFSTSLASIGGYAFGASAIGNGVALTSVTLPSSVTTIGDHVFAIARALTYLDLSATNITFVNNYTASGCTALQTVKLPATLLNIGQSAFSGCTHLTDIVIPATVTTIQKEAFSNCTSLASIKFEGTTPPTVTNANAWANLPTTCTIQVPTGSLTAYTTANNYPNPNTYTYVEY